MLKPIFQKLFKIREDANRRRQQSLRPGADDGFDPYEKPFLDHLEDLRKTIGKVLMTLMVATILAFVFNKEIFQFALLPLKIDLLGLNEGKPLATYVRFLTLSPQEILMLSIKVAFLTGIIACFPLLVYFLGEFILPGLKQQEKKYVVPGVGVGFILFIIGASFAFFLAAPIALKFFYQFQLERVPILNPTSVLDRKTLSVDEILKAATDEGAAALEKNGGETSENGEVVAIAPEPDPALRLQMIKILQGLLATPEDSELVITFDANSQRFVFSNNPLQTVSYRIGDYINFVTRLTLVFGLSFQLPVVVVILVKIRLLTARVMRNTRAYAWVIMLVASAIFTPPDIFTLALLAGPLVILYEACIWIASGMEYRRDKRERAEEDARKSRLERLYSKPADDLTEEEKAELHQHEIDQYEKEHEGLYEEESAHVEHDPGHGDPHIHGDSEHDESWHSDHHGHDDPYHDPHHDEHGHYIGPDHDEYGHPIDPEDPHAGETPHEPVQDWPDDPEKADDAGGAGDSAQTQDGPDADATSADDTDSDSSSPEDPTADDDSESDWDDDDVCEPSGPVVNLNTATEEELQTLPGIGPAMAKRLIEHRPFHSFDDVTAVPGIGDDKLYAMMDRLSIDSGGD